MSSWKELQDITPYDDEVGPVLQAAGILPGQRLALRQALLHRGPPGKSASPVDVRIGTGHAPGEGYGVDPSRLGAGIEAGKGYTVTVPDTRGVEERNQPARRGFPLPPSTGVASSSSIRVLYRSDGSK